MKAPLSYYDIISKHRECLSKQEINLTIKKLDKENISEKAKYLIASILFREYTKKSQIFTTKIAEYTGMYKYDVYDISVLSRELGKLTGEVFNNILELSLFIWDTHTVRYTASFILTIHTGQLDKITKEALLKIDYTKNIYTEFEEKIPDFAIRCEVCNKYKPISSFTKKCSCCFECRERGKKDKRVDYKKSALYSMAIESSKEIKKDLLV